MRDRGTWACAAVCLALALCGCGRKDVGQGKGSKKSPPSLPQYVASSGIDVRWQEQLKDGRLVPILEVHAETGDLNAQSQSGRLMKTRGRFYSKGKAIARFQAPEVDARRDRREVVARGGVTLWSINPPGLIVKARRVTWSTVSGTIVMRDEVRFVYAEPGAVAATASGGPFGQVTLNSAMRRLTVP